MYEKILSIGIIFCDKDYKYLPNMLKSIDRKVYCPFEVIIVDNRNDKSFDIEGNYLKEYRKLMEIKYLINDENKGTLMARKQIAYASDGDYLWYTDVDDEVFDSVPPKILENLTEDLVIFNYVTQQNNRPIFQSWRYIYKEETLSIENMKLCDYQVSNWAKWHNVKSLRAMWDKYNFEFISAIEDTCLFLAALFTYKTCKLLPYTFYYYNSDISSTNTTNIETADRFYYAVAGFSNACNFIKLICQNNRLKEDAEAIIRERRDWMVTTLLHQTKMPKEEFVKSLNILKEEAGHTNELIKDTIYRRFKESVLYQEIVNTDNFRTLCSLIDLDYNEVVEYLKPYWLTPISSTVVKSSQKPLLFLVTKTCNKKCSYCANGKVHQDKIDSKTVANRLKIALEKWDKLYGLPKTICLTGGEPTMLDPEEFKDILEKYSDHLFYIYTNGYNIEGWKQFKNTAFHLHCTDGLFNPQWFTDTSIEKICYIGNPGEPMFEAWKILEKCHSKVMAVQNRENIKNVEKIDIERCRSVEGNWIVDLTQEGEIVSPCCSFQADIKTGTIENRPCKKDNICDNCKSPYSNFYLG